MDSQRENLEISNQKHVHGGDNSEQNKRIKLETPEEAYGVTRITDVNDKCLIHIFEYLMLQDLINAADTCKRFQLPAELTFETKCRQKEIDFNFDRYPSQPIKLRGNIIRISNFTSALKVLRHFGSKISKLNVAFGHLDADQHVELARYMNEYCADSLIDIKIRDATEKMVTNWTKPFTNAEFIHLYWSHLRDLNVWFPNMRYLEFRGYLKFIKKTFSHLEELDIFTYLNSTDVSNVAEILRLNPHLQKLHLSGGIYDMQFMKGISGNLQSITLLDVSCDRLCSRQERKIHLECVNEFHIDLQRNNSLPKIPFSFNRLEKVKLTVKTFKLNNNFINFIKQNPLLNNLAIHVRKAILDPLSIEEIKSNLIKVSPSLEVEFVEQLSRVIKMEEFGF